VHTTRTERKREAMAAQTQQTAKGNGAKTYAFKPIKFDVNAMEPEAQVGEYEAVIENVKVAATSADKYPMLVIEWKLTKAADDDNDKSVGATVPDFIAFFPEGDSKGRMGKLRIRQLCEKLDVDLDLLPTNIEDKSDFDEFIRAIRRQSMTVFVTHREDKSGEMRVGVQYNEPKGSLSAAGRGESEEEEEESSKARKPAGKKARR
jgi:hypothetical protein